MASTYSNDLKLELVATGEKAGLWGSITNTNLQILQQAASGFLSLENFIIFFYILSFLFSCYLVFFQYLFF